jgi:hypothetical protein
MPLNLIGDTAVADGECLVEDALALLEFLQANGGARVDLRACIHVHTAVLQVLLATRPTIVALPREAFLGRWLPHALGLPQALSQQPGRPDPEAE